MYKKRKRFRLEEGLNFLKHRNFPPCLFSGLVIFASTRHNPHPNSAANAADCGISILCVKVWGGKFLCGRAIYFLFAAKASDKSVVQPALLGSLSLSRSPSRRTQKGPRWCVESCRSQKTSRAALYESHTRLWSREQTRQIESPTSPPARLPKISQPFV